jgi:hypothetical protein
VLRLGGEDEPRIVLVTGMKDVVVVVDPSGEAGAELLDEWAGDLLEATARGLRRERDVEDDHTPLEVTRARQLARRRKGELGARGHGVCVARCLHPGVLGVLAVISSRCNLRGRCPSCR